MLLNTLLISPLQKYVNGLAGSAGGGALESGISNWKHGNVGKAPEMMLGLSPSDPILDQLQASLFADQLKSIHSANGP